MSEIRQKLELLDDQYLQEIAFYIEQESLYHTEKYIAFIKAIIRKISPTSLALSLPDNHEYLLEEDLPTSCASKVITLFYRVIKQDIEPLDNIKQYQIQFLKACHYLNYEPSTFSDELKQEYSE